ncbi:hypothetical protein N658DRAFT_526800 [Parathielavia hyrcaniae]|uniref:Nonsense-mediated mRNA decay factor n=1 Tax=Parathielavia hyrcaniae TaxID=113614 RepID=A0AAN6PU31_9PEZI|nr:hypothetical protein N658DRAFT_526800 [Parathielavia hyrcaniae]
MDLDPHLSAIFRFYKFLEQYTQETPKIQCPSCGAVIEAPSGAGDHDKSTRSAAQKAFVQHVTDCHPEAMEKVDSLLPHGDNKPSASSPEANSGSATPATIGKDVEPNPSRSPGTKSTDAAWRKHLPREKNLPRVRLQNAEPGVQPHPTRPPSSRRKAVSPDSSAAASEDRPPKSPTPKRDGSRSRSRSESPPKRYKARAAAHTGIGSGIERNTYQKGRLRTSNNIAAPPPRTYDKSDVATHQRQRPFSGSAPKSHGQSHTLPARTASPPPADHGAIEMLKEPETRPISQEQLVAEVKGIYAGLVMVESKCIEVDNNQSSQHEPPSKLNKNTQGPQTGPSSKLNNDQWQALIALHRTLLHEHHDFFLVSQHPSASPALRRLAAKYAMPARMWRHGIHSFLELLRHRLPASLDHMLTFIYMAYSMMALLYETVPAFEDTWIECLGDLGRYRMAIEDDDMRDREVWTAVSRHWYSRASDKAPTTGRLYHHLAILARPNAQQQLYYYAKSLCVELPFPSARESIMTLFEPIMSRTPNPQQAKLPPAELYFVRTHGILFSGKQEEDLEPSITRFFELIDNHIGRSTRRWLESGYHIGIANICAIMGYGDETNPIAQALKIARPSDSESQDQPMQDSSSEIPLPHVDTSRQFPNARRLFNITYDVVCRRFGDPNILPFLHVTLVFIHHLTFCPEAMAHVAPHFPWKLTAFMLNTLIGSSQNVSQALVHLLESDEPFPGWKEKQEEKNEGTDGEPRPRAPKRRPLPEDFSLRGFPFVESYFPDGWFSTEEKIDDDDKYFEVPSMIEERKERVVWLGCRIAGREGGRWLRFDKETKRFGVNPEYEVDLDLKVPGPLSPTPGESSEYGELPDAGALA